MSDNLKSKKLSMPNLNNNPRKSVLRIDSKFEFDAPKFYDFSQRDIKKEFFLQNEEYIDPWFYIEHRNAPIAKFNTSSSNMINIISSKSELMKKRQSGFRKENEKQVLVDSTSGEKIISIDEMIKIHNDKVKKRKYSQFEKENVSIERNLGYGNKNMGINQAIVDNKNLLLRTKKKFTASNKNFTNNKLENFNPKQNSFTNLRNFNKLNEFNSIKSNSFMNNVTNNNLLASAKKPTININKINSNEEKLVLKTAQKKDSNNRDLFRDKTVKKVPLRMNHFEMNQNNQSANNSSTNLNTKKFKRGFSASNETFKDNKSLKSKNIPSNSSTGGNSSRNRNLTHSSVTYCPRLFSASIMKKWEKLKGVSWYNLSPSSRNVANNDIGELLRNNNL